LRPPRRGLFLLRRDRGPGSLECGFDELEIRSRADARGLAERSPLVVRGKLPLHVVKALSKKTRVVVGHDVVAEAKDAELALTGPVSLAARASRRRSQRWSPARHQFRLTI
jgi:hypothetical protein